jgi:hypothetical protein
MLRASALLLPLILMGALAASRWAGAASVVGGALMVGPAAVGRA